MELNISFASNAVNAGAKVLVVHQLTIIDPPWENVLELLARLER